MKANIFATNEISKLNSYVDLADVQGLKGSDFEIDYSTASADALFVIKQSTDHSVSDAVRNMDYLDTGTDIDTWRLLSEIYANQKISANTLYYDYGIGNYKEVLSCLDDKNFTGILLFNQNINISSYADLGPERLLKDSELTVPVIKIEDVVFSEQGIDVQNAHVKGILYGHLQKHLSDRDTSDDESFDFEITDTWADFVDGEFCLPQITCKLELHKMYGFQIAMSLPLNFIGTYILNDNLGGSTATYQLRQLSDATIEFADSPMNSIKFVSAQSQLNTDGAKLNISLNFRGRICFGALADGSDFFSYENLSFRNMRLEITYDGTQGKLQYVFREMLLSEDEAGIRETSFLGCVQHGTPFIVSGQDCGTPADMQFAQMNVGSAQENITTNDSWLGIAVPVDLFHGISVDILFAFAPDKFYAGYRLGNGVSSVGATISSLIRLEMKEVQVEKLSSENISKNSEENEVGVDNGNAEASGYAIALRGAKFFVFGKEFPEGSVDLVLIPSKASNCSGTKMVSDAALSTAGWYAIYDRMK